MKDSESAASGAWEGRRCCFATESRPKAGQFRMSLDRDPRAFARVSSRSTICS